MLEFTDAFKGIFGKISPGLCRLTMNGNIAVKCSNGYKTYNIKKGTLTNVSNFTFNMGDEMFFVVPTKKAHIGDIILVNGKPKCVIKVEANAITVMDYETSELKTIVPERHVFMGSTYFYGKIVSMFGNSFKSGNGLKNMLKMMMMSQMMRGDGQGQGGLGQMMAMSMFMNNEDNPFNGMFDLDDDSIGVDFDEDDEDDEDNNNKEESEE